MGAHRVTGGLEVCFGSKFSPVREEDAAMDLVHAPVDGTTVVEAGEEQGPYDSVISMDLNLGVGADHAMLDGGKQLELQGCSSGGDDGRGTGWQGPQVGHFCMGTIPDVNMESSSCMQGVRPLAPSNINDLGVLGGPPSRKNVAADPAKPAWGKPVVVPLPGIEALGDAVIGGRVQLDEAEVLTTVRRFDSALVGRLFGRRHSFEFLNSALHRIWKGFGAFKLVTMSGDCFVCFFDSVDSRNAVVMGGPWVVAGQVVGIDVWSPTFSPGSFAGFTTPVWVRLPGLPMYYWGGKNIGRIASLLGEPIWMDAATDRLERGYFARVCIRIDLSKALRPGMWIDGPFGSFFQAIEYEGLPTFCFVCGHVGHQADGCTNRDMSTAGLVSSVDVPGSGVRNPVGANEGAEAGLGTAPPAAGDSSTRQEDEAGSIGVERRCAAEASVEEMAQLAHESEPTPVGLGPWMLVTRKKKPPARGVGFGAPVLSRPRPVGASGVGGADGRSANPPSFGGTAESRGSKWRPKETRRSAPRLAKGGEELPMIFSAKSSNSSGKSKDVEGHNHSKVLPGKGATSSGKPRNSKSFAEREVEKLGPLIDGSRMKKRKQHNRGDGGDASPLVE